MCRCPGTESLPKKPLDDGIAFKENMNTPTTKLADQFTKSDELGDTIRKNLKSIGYEF